MSSPGRSLRASPIRRAVWALQGVFAALRLVLGGPVRRWHTRGLLVFRATDGGADHWLLAPSKDAAAWELTRYLWRNFYRPFDSEDRTEGTDREFLDAIDEVHRSVRIVPEDEQRAQGWQFELGSGSTDRFTLADAARWARRGWAIDPGSRGPWWRRIEPTGSLYLGSTDY